VSAWEGANVPTQEGASVPRWEGTSVPRWEGTLAPPGELSVCGGDAVLCQITLTTCFYYCHCAQIEQSRSLIELALEGLAYYHNYDRTLLG